jgi:hypothetical protein
MRGVFGILGLLVVVAIVGVLAKKQLGAGVAPTATSTAAVPGGPAINTAAPPKQQVEQFKQAVEGAMQQARPPADEGK